MRYFLRSFQIVLALLVFQSSSVFAEVYFWQDPVSKMSLTVPDTWRMSHDQKPDDVVTFLAPGAGDYASCRMRIREDKRFAVYPRRYEDEIQRVYFSRSFWEGYVSEFTDAVLNDVHDNAGLGRGFASYADVSFVTAVGSKVEKRGIMFASLYGNKVYVAECSAQSNAFSKWYPSFMSIVKSVDFRKRVPEFSGGYYRNFFQDYKLVIYGKGEMDRDYY
ncbi:MAG: hypothetical protein KAJ86_04745 [Alphaproteobacteria bacterium]|nr:hypothetical protein [Alphaproteobacteria bacterium]